MIYNIQIIFFSKTALCKEKRRTFVAIFFERKLAMSTTIDDVTLRRGYWYILRNPKGYLSELDRISDCLADYFANAGIIAYGVTSRAELRYTVTPEGERIAKVDYTSLTLKLFREKNSHTKAAVR